MRRKVCFFNYFHNGDVFNSKGYVQAIMRAYPGLDYSYALGADPAVAELPHFGAAAGTRPDSIKDLRCQIVTCDKLPEGLGWWDRFAMTEEWLFVNTWVGAYYHEVFPPGEIHANYRSLRKMFGLIYERLNADLGLNLTISEDYWDAVPDTDWSVYNRAAADEFVIAHPCAKRLLFCNGPAKSEQSSWGDDDMRDVVEALAMEHPDWNLLCTKRFATELGNVCFTDDIFRQDSDLNEIAYLSTRCDLIWGKVSGPYMFCHVRENLFDPATVFFSCSDRPSDSLPFGCGDVVCRYYHSLTSDRATLVRQINDVMLASASPSQPGAIVVLDAD